MGWRLQTFWSTQSWRVLFTGKNLIQLPRALRVNLKILLLPASCACSRCTLFSSSLGAWPLRIQVYLLYLEDKYSSPDCWAPQKRFPARIEPRWFSFSNETKDVSGKRHIFIKCGTCNRNFESSLPSRSSLPWNPSTIHDGEGGSTRLLRVLKSTRWDRQWSSSLKMVTRKYCALLLRRLLLRAVGDALSVWRAFGPRSKWENQRLPKGQPQPQRFLLALSRPADRGNIATDWMWLLERYLRIRPGLRWPFLSRTCRAEDSSRKSRTRPGASPFACFPRPSTRSCLRMYPCRFVVSSLTQARPWNLKCRVSSNAPPLRTPPPILFRTFLIYLAYRETVNVLNTSTWLLLYDYCYCTFIYVQQLVIIQHACMVGENACFTYWVDHYQIYLMENPQNKVSLQVLIVPSIISPRINYW